MVSDQRLECLVYSMCNMIQSFVPPIFYKLYKYVHKKSMNVHPSWNRILGGPLEGCVIYVPANMPSFNEMILGRYDDFFWSFLEDEDLRSGAVIDVGGHVGYHSMCFAKLAGSGSKIYVFEPNVHNVERMELNFKKNNGIFSLIEINKIALAECKGVKRFYFSANVDDEASMGGYIHGSYKPLSDTVYKKAGFTSVDVEITALDNFAKERDLIDIRLLKIDVEGAEHMVIKGAKETITKFRPTIMIEIHSMSTMLAVCSCLYSLNYSVEILNEDNRNRCFLGARYRE